ncbi:short-chain dehydrogenase [Actinomadura sp. CNU-125]|uniref:SDR family NAD(P)-dependent oxidoreductase n=1 Tax=Actinomadura sp. CNU-125 TaxID=1904961 RepID=UPI00096460CD|nr:SDR family oxidoreductase [Actinomadura sp. CNU-125]OLT37755.1 short-chain dehydrogenase [Actinomadura sp. CNU-125]
MSAEHAPREHAVVTGGSSGIGLAVVRRLMKRGLAVTVLDMRPPPDDLTPAFEVDATDEAAVRDALAAAARDAGTPTRLVTCHGIRGEFKPALELDLDAYRRVLDVHLVGTLVTARSLVAGMLEAGLDGGSIVTISSTTAYGGWRDQADYGVAKAAVEQLTQNLAIEWAPHGIRVNAVAPGHTLTPMVQEMVDQGYDLSATEARMPLGRLCFPDEMAAAIEFMLLDATFSTGVRMPVDGGWTVVGK